MDRLWNQRLAWLIAAATLIRLALAVSWDLGNDEAYYALHRHHLDWCFIDHPPMVAFVAAIGPWLCGNLATPLTLRLGFIALGAASTYLLARITAQISTPRAGWLAAALFSLSGYFGIVTSTLISPDGPLVFGWLWALQAWLQARNMRDSIPAWVAAGLAWAFAAWSKFTAVLWLAGPVLLMLTVPACRASLRRRGPWIAATAALLALAPLLLWNAQHGWSAFLFQGGRAAPAGRWSPLGPPLLFAAQAAYLFPWIALVLLRTLVRRARFGVQDQDLPFLALALPAIGIFPIIALGRWVLPHWGLVGFLGLFPLAARDWDQAWIRNPKITRRLAAFAALSLLLITLAIGQARWGVFTPHQATAGKKAPLDPTLDAYGWDQVAREVTRLAQTQPAPPAFIATSRWFLSAQLAAALDIPVPVLCLHARDARGFAFWSRPEDWLGKDGFLVTLEPTSVEPAVYDRYFERIEPLGTVSVLRAGGSVRRFQIHRLVRMTLPFPFDNDLDRNREENFGQASSRAVRR
jgi:hypothetical protein